MNIGELRSWLKNQDQNTIAVGHGERRALEAVGRIYPEVFERFIGQITCAAVMRLDPETLWHDPSDADFEALSHLLNDETYTMTYNDWLQAISRLKLTRELDDEYELFEINPLLEKLNPIMEGMEEVSLEKYFIFKHLVAMLEDMRNHA